MPHLDSRAQLVTAAQARAKITTAIESLAEAKRYLADLPYAMGSDLSYSIDDASTEATRARELCTNMLARIP